MKYLKEKRIKLGGFIPERSSFAKQIKALEKEIATAKREKWRSRRELIAAETWKHDKLTRVKKKVENYHLLFQNYRQVRDMSELKQTDEYLTKIREYQKIIYLGLELNERCLPVANPTEEVNVEILSELQGEGTQDTRSWKNWPTQAERYDPREFHWIMHPSQPMYEYLMKVPSISLNHTENKIKQMANNI